MIRQLMRCHAFDADMMPHYATPSATPLPATCYAITIEILRRCQYRLPSLLAIIAEF